MKTFSMIRNFDSTGVSGTGKILEGAIYSNGQVVVYWLGKDFNSFGIYQHYYAFYFLHVKSHPTNKTEIRFNNEDICPEPVKRKKQDKCRHCGFEFLSHPLDVQDSLDNGNRRTCSGNLIKL